MTLWPFFNFASYFVCLLDSRQVSDLNGFRFKSKVYPLFLYLSVSSAEEQVDRKVWTSVSRGPLDVWWVVIASFKNEEMLDFYSFTDTTFFIYIC